MKTMAFILLSIGLAILCWGGYGPLLRLGGDAMGHSHLLPFIFVGVAYFLIAVLVPIALLWWRGEPGNWTASGLLWSVAAGTAGALGALGVILALTHNGSPIYVMPLVFGGAPVVNTIVTMGMSKTYREAGPFFYAGLILVIAGSAFVLIFNPAARAAQQASFGELIKVLAFVGLAIVSWGFYGPVLHKGQMHMHGSRLRPFIGVGLAYFVVAVILPVLLRATAGDQGELTFTGAAWSLAGGAAGALGALGIILAFTFGGKPVYVMPLVFGGAPVMNTLISIAAAGDLTPIKPLFYAGLIVVVAGAVSVLVFAPRGAPHGAPASSGAP